MNQDDIAAVKAVLERLHFLEHMTPQEMNELIKDFEKRDVARGESLITQGKSGDIFYILASGKAGIYHKRHPFDKRVAVLEPPSYFGEMSLISDEPRSASVVMEEDGTVYSLLRRDFDKVVMGNPAIAAQIRKTMAEREQANRVIEQKEWMGNKMPR